MVSAQKKAYWLFAILLSALLSSSAESAIVSFVYDGTDGGNTRITATGQFSFLNANAASLSLADLTSFTLHEISNSGNGLAIGYFDFTKADLISFTVALADGVVTNATFQTQKKQETSSPTNTDYHAHNFVALSATTGKTQYGDGATVDHTFGALTFSPVPEPSAVGFLLAGVSLLAIRRAKRTSA